MTEQYPSTIGTVAQEAARLIEDMATMARTSYLSSEDSSPYPGEAGRESGGRPESAGSAERDQAPGSEPGAHQSGGWQAADESSDGVCSLCGAGPDDAPSDDTPSSCTVCPLCRGISLLRSIRPETVDLLADLAMSIAAGLRDVAMWSRGAEPDPFAGPSSARSTSARSTAARSSSARSTSAASPDADRSPVQDIPVDDESEE